jgi:hypothetical protein
MSDMLHLALRFCLRLIEEGGEPETSSMSSSPTRILENPLSSLHPSRAYTPNDSALHNSASIQQLYSSRKSGKTQPAKYRTYLDFSRRWSFLPCQPLRGCG